MYQDYTIVCCTAAGRMRYMQYIFPYVLASATVDRYDIWVNTTNMVDIEYFKLIAQRYPKVRLVWQPDGRCDGIATINAFYRDCIDDKTIYIKIDDDIVWMQPDVFDRMVEFRIKHPEAFLVTPHVVNNPMSSYLWQVKGMLSYGEYMRAFPNHRVLWKRGAFALALHHYFLEKMENDQEAYKQLFCGIVPVACNRFSINFVMWFGSDMARIKGVVPGDDEEYLSSVVAPKFGQLNYYNGDCVVAHFAFGPQRLVLDKTDVLERYGRLCEYQFCKNKAMQEVWETIKGFGRDIESRMEEILLFPSPYPVKKKSTFSRIKLKYKNWQKLMTHKLEKWKGVEYVVEEGDIFKRE